jgi:hypothetical protein
VKRKNDADVKQDPLYFDVKNENYFVYFFNFFKKIFFSIFPKLGDFYLKVGYNLVIIFLT